MRRTIVLIAAVLMFGACSDKTEAPSVQSDNEEASFKKVDDKSPKVPVDTNLYVIRGKVLGDPSNLVRQTEPGRATLSGYNGFVSGSAFGPRQAGKGFVRLHVMSMQPDAPFASTNDVVLIKTSDTKAAALIPEDIVEFKCRAQYESVAPVQKNERFNKDKYGTWEFDFCRLTSPDIGGE
jgi:hypothetical protein